MTSYLLDTNHLSPLVTLSHPLRLQVLQSLEAGHTFAISVPVLVEVLYGLALLPRASQNLAEWTRLRPSFTCYIPDELTLSERPNYKSPCAGAAGSWRQLMP